MRSSDGAPTEVQIWALLSWMQCWR